MKRLRKTLLPWLQSHGPIEALLCVGRQSPDGHPFRGCKATAPLKRVVKVRPPCRATLLPWLQSHGPIEAMPPHVRLSPTQTPFRGCKATAPLKPQRDGGGSLTPLPFRGCKATAPLKLRHLCFHLPLQTPFRGCKATAPLKRGSGRHPVGVRGQSFRGCKATAPLKPLIVGQRERQVSDLPWLQSHGPIEAAR